MSDERDRVAAELAQYLDKVGLTRPWSYRSGTSTRMKYSEGTDLYPVERLELHDQLIEKVIAGQSQVSNEKSLGVIVTAGPPGVGKTTALRSDPSLGTYRNVDADDFKDELLLDARAQGDLAKWLEHTLSDERPVSERELSGFVHAESTIIAATMRERCLAAGENIIVQGTLSSLNQPNEIMQELERYGYRHLTIVDVEAPQERAVEQALQRWWSGRLELKDGLGGRFVSPESIRQQWAPGKVKSLCAENAERLAELATSFEWDVELRQLS